MTSVITSPMTRMQEAGTAPAPSLEAGELVKVAIRTPASAADDAAPADVS
jgi:hypothetical protein